MDDVIKAVLTWIVGTIGVVGLIVLLAYLTPEKFEAWVRIVVRGARVTPALYRRLERFAVRQSLQTRVNRSIRRMVKRTRSPFLAEGLRVAWVEATESRADFVQRGRVVVCLRRAENPSENLVRATYAFVAASLLMQPKRYLSDDQRGALDLYISGRMLEQSDAVLRDFFLAEYLLPATDGEDNRIVVYFAAFETLARAGLFFEFLLDELDTVGRKVFGQPRSKVFQDEVDGVIDVAAGVAARHSRELVNLTFNREFFRCGLVIVGSTEKMIQSGDVYVSYVMNSLRSRGVETVYLLGFRENRRVLDNVADALAPTYVPFRKHSSDIVLSSGLSARSYTISLSAGGVRSFQPVRREAAAAERVALPAPEPLPAPEERILGTIVTLEPARDYGFIRPDVDFGSDLYFKLSWCPGNSEDIRIGDRVECSVKRYPEGRVAAARIRFVLRATPASGGIPQRGAEETEVGEDTELDPRDEWQTIGDDVHGTVSRYGRRGFGFISLDEQVTAEPAWFHIRSCLEPPEVIVDGMIVRCTVRRHADGRVVAEDVRFMGEPSLGEQPVGGTVVPDVRPDFPS